MSIEARLRELEKNAIKRGDPIYLKTSDGRMLRAMNPGPDPQYDGEVNSHFPFNNPDPDQGPGPDETFIIGTS